MSQVSYKDINMLIGQNNQQEVVEDDAAIINTLIAIIMIPKRSAKFRMGLGSKAQYYLQQQVNQNTAALFQNSLLQDLTTWQPFATINLQDIRVTPNSTNTGYYLNVTFVSKLNGYQSQVSFQLAASQFANSL